MHIFTNDDYRKIQQWLIANAVKDTDLTEVNVPLKGSEAVSVVQDGQNKIVFLRDLVSQIHGLGVSDFFNVTDKCSISHITLEEAIKAVPSRARKIGQVITFINEEGYWKIYQFKGALNQWNILDQWEDLLDWEKFIIDQILPDEEDLTKSIADESGNSYLSLKDREYKPEDFSGLGRIILRKNIVEIEDIAYGSVTKNFLYQDMFTQSNTVYEIRYDFDLNDQTITIPKDCILKYEGGSLNNGHIVYQNTKIQGIESLNNITTEGLFFVIDAAIDEEDLHNNNGILKFADREYNPNTFSGLGKIILRKNIVNDKNILTQDMINKENTIYEIRYDFDLNGEEITIPENCVLKFEGGSLSNGTIKGNGLTIYGNNTHCKDVYFDIAGYTDFSDLNIDFTFATKDVISISDSEYIKVDKVNIHVDENDYRKHEVDGIHIIESTNISITDCVFDGTKSAYKDSSQGAIFIYNGGNITISNCTAKNVKAECFTTEYCTNVKISDCYFTAISGSALAINYGDYNTITNCIAEDCTASTFSINSNNVTIANCICRNNVNFNAITLGHTQCLVHNATVTNNIIETEKCAFGGVISGNIVLSGNSIVCGKLASFDMDSNNPVGKLSLINNIVHGTNNNANRFSLVDWEVNISNNKFDKVGTITGYLKNSRVTVDGNSFVGNDKGVVDITTTPNFFSFTNNKLIGLDLGEITSEISLVRLSDVNEIVIDSNYVNNQDGPSYNIHFVSIVSPTNVKGLIRNNMISVKRLGVVFDAYKNSENGNDFILYNNTIKTDNSVYLWVSDEFSKSFVYDNVGNNKTCGDGNGDLSVTPNVYLIYTEKDFGRLWQRSIAKVIRDIDNTEPVNARFAIDFTGGGRINGDVNLQNTRIIPNGCVIEDYIKGTISGTYAIGQCLFDKTLGKPKYWTGTIWVDANGTEV